MQTILPEKISSFDYYINKLPLYLQESEGFCEHFRIWYDLLVGNKTINGIKGTCDTLLDLLNIFDDDFLNKISNLENSGKSTQNPYGDKSDILDKIGLLYGVKRRFTITYVNSGVSYTENINLNNEDFLTYIKFQIIKNNCNGSREQIQQYYDNSTNLKICILNQPTSAMCHVYLIDSGETKISDNIKHLFLAGELIIKSQGIKYLYASGDPLSILIWDKGNWDDNDVRWIL